MHDVRFVIRAAAELPETTGWLGPDERERHLAMRVARRRADFLLGRFAAHELLAALLGPGEHDVRAAASGAPEPWLDGAPAAAAISISHRSGVALCAGTRAPLRIGADLEAVEPRSQGFVGDFFTADEIARVVGAAAGERDERVAVIWSAKESVLKALRHGLRVDTRAVELRHAGAARGDRWAALEVAYGSQCFTGWWTRVGSLVATVVADEPFALQACCARP